MAIQSEYSDSAQAIVLSGTSERSGGLSLVLHMAYKMWERVALAKPKSLNTMPLQTQTHVHTHRYTHRQWIKMGLRKHS